MDETPETVEPIAPKEEKKAAKNEKKDDKKKEKGTAICLQMLDSVIEELLGEIKVDKHPKLVVAIAHARSCRDRIKEVVAK